MTPSVYWCLFCVTSYFKHTTLYDTNEFFGQVQFKYPSLIFKEDFPMLCSAHTTHFDRFLGSTRVTIIFTSIGASRTSAFVQKQKEN